MIDDGGHGDELANWLGKTQRHYNLTQKPLEVAFSVVYSNFEKCRLEVADDAISGVAVD